MLCQRKNKQSTTIWNNKTIWFYLIASSHNKWHITAAATAHRFKSRHLVSSLVLPGILKIKSSHSRRQNIQQYACPFDLTAHSFGLWLVFFVCSSSISSIVTVPHLNFWSIDMLMVNCVFFSLCSDLFFQFFAFMMNTVLGDFTNYLLTHTLSVTQCFSSSAEQIDVNWLTAL